MYSRQVESVKRMSMGTSICPRTRAKHGLSHRRSTLRLRMVPSVAVERQLSKVMGMFGCVFVTSAACSFVMPQPQPGTRP